MRARDGAATSSSGLERSCQTHTIADTTLGVDARVRARQQRGRGHVVGRHADHPGDDRGAHSAVLPQRTADHVEPDLLMALRDASRDVRTRQVLTSGSDGEVYKSKQGECRRAGGDAVVRRRAIRRRDYGCDYGAEPLIDSGRSTWHWATRHGTLWLSNIQRRTPWPSRARRRRAIRQGYRPWAARMRGERRDDAMVLGCHQQPECGGRTYARRARDSARTSTLLDAPSLGTGR